MTSDKRDYRLEELKGVYGFHDWLKSQPFIVIGCNSRIKKRNNYLSCIEGKGCLKDDHCSAQTAGLFVDLL